MSGAFNTAKPACSTCALCRWPTLPMWPSTSWPIFRLSLICAVVLMSSIAAHQRRVLGLDVHAADQVGAVLALGHPARGGAAGAALG